MCVTICGIFCPNEGAVAGYGGCVQVKCPHKVRRADARNISDTLLDVYISFFVTNIYVTFCHGIITKMRFYEKTYFLTILLEFSIYFEYIL